MDRSHGALPRSPHRRGSVALRACTLSASEACFGRLSQTGGATHLDLALWRFRPRGGREGGSVTPRTAESGGQTRGGANVLRRSHSGASPSTLDVSQAPSAGAESRMPTMLSEASRCIGHIGGGSKVDLPKANGESAVRLSSRHGSGTPRSRQIFRARWSLISRCRGIAERRFESAVCHHECRPPSRRSSQPCCVRCRNKSRRFIRR